MKSEMAYPSSSGPMLRQMAAPIVASMSYGAPPPPPDEMMYAEAEMSYSKQNMSMARDEDLMMLSEDAGYEREAMAYDDKDDASYEEEESDYLDDRKEQQQFYKVLDKTKEYAENNYYKLPITRQDNSLIPINAFWADFANYPGSGAFLSKNFVLATSNFTEVMFVASVLDLAMSTGTKDEALDVAFEDTKLVLNTKKSTIAFHKEIKECPVER